MTSKNNDQVPIANAYAVVPTKEEVEDAAAIEYPGTVTVLSNNSNPRIELDRPLGTGVSSQYAHISEAQRLTWMDDFFDNDEDVIAVFDYDYENMESHYRTLGWGCFAGTVLCFPGSLFWCLLGLVPCHINKNVTWSVRARHLAVTRHGILLVDDQRPSLWGEQCAVSKHTKTIPFDQITNCTVTDVGADTTCAFGSNLSKVTIESPNSNMVTIVGLQDPHALAKLVLALKRQPPQPAALAVTMAERIDRGLATGGDEVAGILREIRDELRQHNELLQDIKPAASQS